MTDLAERLTRDLREIAEHAATSANTWHSLLARIDEEASDPDSHEMEVVMLTPNRQSSKSRTWMLAAAAAAVVLGVAAVVVVTDNDNDDAPPATAVTQPADTEPADTQPADIRAADTQAALDLANQFVTARDAWDSDAIRALLSNDAVISDLAASSPDAYVVNADFERVLQWRFMQPDCTVSVLGPPAQVRCAYMMENVLSRALGVGPYEGSSFRLSIADGQIQQATNDFDHSRYAVEALEPFQIWLEANWPDDVEILWAADESGRPGSATTPESVALWQRHIDEFAAIQTALAFVDARNAWDGPAMRALVADDAAITDFAIESADEYLPMADLERALQWQYLEPECSATVGAAATQVNCSYSVQNAMTQAAGIGPYSGSRLNFTISDGLIRRITNTFDHSLYGTEVLVPFTAWLDANHPGDTQRMFVVDEFDEVNRSLTPESLALWAERIPEYVAVLTAG